MDVKAVIISGEASESDEESSNIKTGIPFSLLLASNSCGTMVQGEARKSNEENNSINISNNVFDPSNCSYIEIKEHKREKSCVKYNSLLHKKLRECNKLFDRDIQDLLSSTTSYALEELIEANKQLLKSELILQKTVSKFQTASVQFEDSLNSIKRILEENFFQAVKLKYQI